MAGQRQSSLLDVDDKDFIAGLQKAVSEMQVGGRRGLIKVGNDIANAAKRYCPVDTGRLRAAIAAHPGEDADGPYVDIGVTLADLQAASAEAQARVQTNAAAGKKSRRAMAERAKPVGVNYAIFVELGTSRMAAQPFLRPALAEVSGFVGKTIAGQMGRHVAGPAVAAEAG